MRDSGGEGGGGAIRSSCAASNAALYTKRDPDHCRETKRRSPPREIALPRDAQREEAQRTSSPVAQWPGSPAGESRHRFISLSLGLAFVPLALIAQAKTELASEGSLRGIGRLSSAARPGTGPSTRSHTMQPFQMTARHAQWARKQQEQYVDAKNVPRPQQPVDSRARPRGPRQDQTNHDRIIFGHRCNAV